jgi:homoserine dehydrogenase
MRHDRLMVLKFGSSVLHSEADLPQAVHEIYRWWREGYQVVAVVSAVAGVTDALFEQAQRYGSDPDPAALAALVATGESTSAALLTLGLDRAGVPARSVDAARLGLRTAGPRLNAKPCFVNVAVLKGVLERGEVAVVPGFVGRTSDGQVSLLGRGGSDLTALYIAVNLRADRCRLIKDVAGISEHDPHDGAAPARRYAVLSWDDVPRCFGVVQQKAVQFAHRENFAFEVSGLGCGPATLVGAGVTTLCPIVEALRPLRVGLLGLGTIGYGVYRQLVAHPERFEVAGIAIRNVARERNDVPRHLLTTDPWTVVAGDCDIIIETLGGISPAAELIEASLRGGKHVITANKVALAGRFGQFLDLARQNGVELLASGAVGGAVPILEALTRIAKQQTVQSVEGVLNGTTNFILNELARGLSFAESVELAKVYGFAEPDPTSDLDGSDVACKLALLARAAFGVDLEPATIPRSGILDIDARHVFDQNAIGRAVRLVGRLSRTESGIVAEVRPLVVEAPHPFTRTQREQNCVIVELKGGAKLVLRGKGAGRWPTTEAVFADLMSLARKYAVPLHGRTAELAS